MSEQNAACDGPSGYHDRDCWLGKRVCEFVLACTCTPRSKDRCPSHGERSTAHE